MTTFPIALSVEPWMVLDWERYDQEGAYLMLVGRPLTEVQKSKLVGPKGETVTKEVFLRWEDVQTIAFAVDAEEYSFDDQGERLDEEAILERHIKAVTEAWAAEE